MSCLIIEGASKNFIPIQWAPVGTNIQLRSHRRCDITPLHQDGEEAILLDFLSSIRRAMDSDFGHCDPVRMVGIMVIGEVE